MHSSQTHSSIQHPNMHCSAIIQHNLSNTPVIMHPHNVFSQCFHIVTPQSQFSLTMLYANPIHATTTLEFHLLNIYPDQITDFITSHSIIILNIHLNNYNLPIHIHWPLSKTSNFFTFFIFGPMVPWVEMVTSLILSDAHYLHPRTFWYLHVKKK